MLLNLRCDLLQFTDRISPIFFSWCKEYITEQSKGYLFYLSIQMLLS